MSATATVPFGSLPVGARFRLESMIGVKQEPRVCEQSRAFYAGKVPGYPGASPFYDWNARCQFLGHGGWNELSLAPDREVEPLPAADN